MTREGYDKRWPRRIERAVVVIIVVVVVVVVGAIRESHLRELNPGLKKEKRKEKKRKEKKRKEKKRKRKEKKEKCVRLQSERPPQP